MKPRENEAFDAVIVGGSFAGIAAGLQMARARRRILLLDSGQPRNRFAAHSHGFFGRDGAAPQDMLEEARDQLRRYPTVTWRDDAAVDGRGEADLFAVTTSTGQEFSARRIILAYGVKDHLPDVPGLSRIWGRQAFHCPYCHGYEFAGQPLGILGDASRLAHMAPLLWEWSNDLAVFTLPDQPEFEDDVMGLLEKYSIPVRRSPVTRIEREADDSVTVCLQNGEAVSRAGLLVATTPEPSSDLAFRLGCEHEAVFGSDYVTADERGATSVAGIYVAGDLMQPRATISAAVASGAAAGAACHQSLVFD